MMFNRVLQKLVVINGHHILKCMSVTRFSSIAPRTHPLCTRQICKPNSIHFRWCTSIYPVNKDEEASRHLAEYMKDPDNQKHYNILQLEIDVLRQSGEKIPEELRSRDWLELIQLQSRSKRRKYLLHLFLLEKKKENKMEKKQKSLQEHLNKQPVESDIPDHLQYKLGCNSMFLRIYDHQCNSFYGWKVVQAIMYGQKLVFDCGFEDKMSRFESKYCARQMQLAFAMNRVVKDPFDLYFCNLDKQGFLHRELHSFIPTMYEPHFPLNVTGKSYLDLFDKDKLVYLTPDCKEEMNVFDHEAVYIVGAIVDKVCGVPLSLAKAKREGLRMAKLPLDRYLDFGDGSGKALTLNQMISILAEIKQTGDWTQALRHVPTRKLTGYRQHMNQKRMEKLLERNQNTYSQSSAPQDFSMQARNKFRNK